MGGSVRALRWRRRRYALRARFYRVLRFTGPIIELPGDWHLERQEFWFWRVRLALWAVLAAAGWLVLGWPGAVLGVVAGLLTEAAFSYRLRNGYELEPEPESGPAGLPAPPETD